MSSIRAKRCINIPQIHADVPGDITAPPPAATETEFTKGLPSVKLTDLDIGENLGRGASSSVYLATLKQTGQTFAIKKIALREKREILQQIITELHALRTLKHENIVQLFTAFYTIGNMYILMSLIDGGSLGDLLQVCPQVPEAAIGRLAYHCVQGLLYIRHNHFLHRDLKPSNILVTTKGEVKIADFGMARQLEKSFDKAKSFLGTMCYMSPERLKEEEYGFISDIWSFGIIIYQCAAGQFPLFDSKSPKNTNHWDLIAKLSSDVEVVLPPQYSAELADFISGCLRINPKERTSVEMLVKHPFVTKYQEPEAQELLLQWTSEAQKKIEINNKSKQESLKSFDIKI